MKLTRDFYRDSRFQESIIVKHFEILYNSQPYDGRGLWGVQIFKGKQAKSFEYKLYKTETEMLKIVKRYLEWSVEIEQNKEADKIKRSQELKEFKDKLVVGSILSDSWGYEQTNVEFYEVISINKNKTEVIIRELCHKEVEGSGVSHGMACNVVPGESFSGDPITKKIRSSYGIKICSSITLSLWDGKAKYKSWYA